MKKYIEMRKIDTRSCIVHWAKDEKCFFHMWISGKNHLGKKTVYALVELQDGTMYEVESGLVQFTDRSKKEFEIESNDYLEMQEQPEPQMKSGVLFGKE